MRRFQYAVAVIMTAVMCLMPVLQPYAAYAEALAAERQLHGTSDSSAAEDGAGTSAATEDGSADEGSAGEEASSSTDGSGDGSAAIEPTQPSDAGSETAGSADSAADVSTEDAVTTDESADAAAEDGERDISADEFRGNSWRFENGQLIGGLDDESARSGNFRARAMNALPEGATAQGIDVSEFQYQINWDAVKASGVDFAIIRIGWWNNGVDKYFERNVAECERLGISWGAYLYSYSMDAEDAASEANHAIDLMNQMKAKGYTPDLPVYLDLEDAEVPLDAAKLATISSTFNGKIAAAGYEPGVYASASWWKNYLTSPVFDSWSKWSAQYYSVCEAPSDPDMWQYTSSGSVPGISGPVDVNYWYGESLNDLEEITKKIDEVALQYESELGEPTSEIMMDEQDGVVWREYDNGGVYWSASSGAHPVFGEIFSYWVADGGLHSSLGLPVGDPGSFTQNGGGIAQDFAGGSVHVSNDGVSAAVLSGPIRSEYVRRGFQAGQLGWPIGDAEELSGGGSLQRFQNGNIRVSSSGVVSVEWTAYVGFQNPSQYYQVSSSSVSVPHLGQGIFGYRTESRISHTATRQDCINAMVTRAMDYLGTAYRWDYACAPGVGVDCAGLVMQALYATGMDLSPMNPWDHYYTPGHDHYANDMWNSSRFLH